MVSSRVRIGGRSVFVVSEVDARDAKGDVVELKSSGNKRGTEILNASIALQVACNGSQHVLCCALDKDKTQLIQVEWISKARLLEKSYASFVGNGQRVSFLLGAPQLRWHPETAVASACSSLEFCRRSRPLYH